MTEFVIFSTCTRRSAHQVSLRAEQRSLRRAHSERSERLGIRCVSSQPRFRWTCITWCTATQLWPSTKLCMSSEVSMDMHNVVYGHATVAVHQIMYIK